MFITKLSFHDHIFLDWADGGGKHKRAQCLNCNYGFNVFYVFLDLFFVCELLEILHRVKKVKV